MDYSAVVQPRPSSVNTAWEEQSVCLKTRIDNTYLTEPATNESITTEKQCAVTYSCIINDKTRRNTPKYSDVIDKAGVAHNSDLSSTRQIQIHAANNNAR